MIEEVTFGSRTGAQEQEFTFGSVYELTKTNVLDSRIYIEIGPSSQKSPPTKCVVALDGNIVGIGDCQDDNAYWYMRTDNTT